MVALSEKRSEYVRDSGLYSCALEYSDRYYKPNGKNELIVRNRSKEDKRVVLIGFSEKGMAQFQNLINELMYYGIKVMNSFTEEEIAIFYKMTSSIKDVLKQEKKKGQVQKKVRKIEIE